LIDEVQTGCGATGKFWAFEHFNLLESPDIVSFAKKMQIGGYFYKDFLRPAQAYRIFNTWLGEPSRVLMLEGILDVINKDKLIELNRSTGKKAFIRNRSIKIKNTRQNSFTLVSKHQKHGLGHFDPFV
jgi:4-aminobutyrate aminotransferase/(S)-3-amino-2-methylpropionate transaminase